MVRTPTKLKVLALVACTALALVYSAAYAKPVGPAASGAAIEACMLEDDAQYAQNSSKFACCSHAAGICVICPQPPSAGNRCDVVAYRGKLPGMNVAPMPDVGTLTMK